MSRSWSIILANRAHRNMAELLKALYGSFNQTSDGQKSILCDSSYEDLMSWSHAWLASHIAAKCQTCHFRWFSANYRPRQPGGREVEIPLAMDKAGFHVAEEFECYQRTVLKYWQTTVTEKNSESILCTIFLHTLFKVMFSLPKIVPFLCHNYSNTRLGYRLLILGYGYCCRLKIMMND